MKKLLLPLLFLCGLSNNSIMHPAETIASIEQKLDFLEYKYSDRSLWFGIKLSCAAVFITEMLLCKNRVHWRIKGTLFGTRQYSGSMNSKAIVNVPVGTILAASATRDYSKMNLLSGEINTLKNMKNESPAVDRISE